jgi:phosphoribosyl-AMP cyclohydrolase
MTSTNGSPGDGGNLDAILDGMKYDAAGLVPAVIQDEEDGQVLMVAYMNREALRRTLTEGKTCFWSRSRREYWVKGATSGNFQEVVRVALDCDADCVLVVVRQKGVACHTGKRSCFYRVAEADGSLGEIDTAKPIHGKKNR